MASDAKFTKGLTLTSGGAQGVVNQVVKLPVPILMKVTDWVAWRCPMSVCNLAKNSHPPPVTFHASMIVDAMTKGTGNASILTVSMIATASRTTTVRVIRGISHVFMVLTVISTVMSS